MTKGSNLLTFSAHRTRVIDDASDYFDSDNKWLSKQQRMKLEKLRSQIDAKKTDHKSKITIDFAGRRVYSEAKKGDERLWVAIGRSSAMTFVPRWRYDEARAVRDNEQYELQSERRNEQELPTWNDDDDLINHNMPDLVSPPQVRRSSPSIDDHVSSISVGRTKQRRSLVATRSVTDYDRRKGSPTPSNPRSRIDANDGRRNVSLHVPTVGIAARSWHRNVRFSPQRIAAHRSFSFRHGGRSWYTSHRGRLWIHAAAKEPEPETIAELEAFYLSRADAMDEGQLDFPTEYPTSVLLGCVDVIDCFDRKTYLEQYPDGESDSDYVLFCENPQELFFKMPMRGQHQICTYHLFSSHVLIVLLDKNGTACPSSSEEDSLTTNAIIVFLLRWKSRLKNSIVNQRHHD